MDTPQRGRARDVLGGCGILLVAITAGCAVIAVVTVIVLMVAGDDLFGRPKPLDVDRIQERLRADQPRLDALVAEMRATHPDVASCAGTRVVPGAVGTTVLPSEVWCRGDLVKGPMDRKDLLRMPGQDPASRCGSGPVLVYVKVGGVEWDGAEYLVHSPACTPTSWWDGDPMAGMEFVSLGGPWYAGRQVSNPTGEVER